MPRLINTRVNIDKRVTDAHREAFTDFGCAALGSVIQGRITHSQADSALQMLRGCIYDRGGDLMTTQRLHDWMKRAGIPEDAIDLSGYEDEYATE